MPDAEFPLRCRSCGRPAARCRCDMTDLGIILGLLAALVLLLVAGYLW